MNTHDRSNVMLAKVMGKRHFLADEKSSNNNPSKEEQV